MRALKRIVSVCSLFIVCGYGLVAEQPAPDPEPFDPTSLLQFAAPEPEPTPTPVPTPMPTPVPAPESVPPLLPELLPTPVLPTPEAPPPPPPTIEPVEEVVEEKVEEVVAPIEEGLAELEQKIAAAEAAIDEKTRELDTKGNELIAKGEAMIARGEAAGETLVAQGEAMVNEAVAILEAKITAVEQKAEQTLLELEARTDVMIADAEAKLMAIEQAVEEAIEKIEVSLDEKIAAVELVIDQKVRELDEKGTQLIAKGEAMIARGEAAGEEMIAQGEAMVNEAAAIMEAKILAAEQKAEQTLLELEARVDKMIADVEAKILLAEQKMEEAIAKAEAYVEEKLEKAEAYIEEKFTAVEEGITAAEAAILAKINAIQDFFDRRQAKIGHSLDDASESSTMSKAKALGARITAAQERWKQMKKEERIVAVLGGIKANIIDVVKGGIKKSLQDRTYGEFMGPLSGNNKVSTSLLEYIDILFSRFVKYVMNWEFDPEENAFYDDSSLGLFGAAELGSAILLRGIKDLEKANVLYKQTAEGQAAYEEQVGGTEQEYSRLRVEVGQAYKEYAKIFEHAGERDRSVFGRGSADMALETYKSARDAYAAFGEKYAASKEMFKKELLTFKFERVPGKPKESVSDFFNREGWRLSNRVSDFKKISMLFADITAPFVRATGMTPVAMIQLFTQRPEEAAMRLMATPARYAEGFEQKFRGYVEKAEGKVTTVVERVLERAEIWEKAVVGKIKEISAPMRSKLGKVALALATKYEAIHQEALEMQQRVLDLKEEIELAMDEQVGRLQNELEKAIGMLVKLEKELRDAGIEVTRYIADKLGMLVVMSKEMKDDLTKVSDDLRARYMAKFVEVEEAQILAVDLEEELAFAVDAQVPRYTQELGTARANLSRLEKELAVLKAEVDAVLGGASYEAGYTVGSVVSKITAPLNTPITTSAPAPMPVTTTAPVLPARR